MNFKKIVFVIAFLGIVAGGFFVNAQPAQAATVEELQVQIQSLLRQIEQLRVQLAQLKQSSPGPTFQKNLQMADRNEEVRELQKILKSEGLFCAKCLVTGYFGYWTKVALMNFQKRYGLAITGIVDSQTRAKLNQVLPQTTPTPTPTPSPATTPTPVPAPVATPSPVPPQLPPTLPKIAPTSSTNKTCSTITTASDLGIIDVTTCKLQTKGQIKVGVVEFAPQNVVYGSVSYANLKSLSGCPSSCGKTGYSWINGLNASNACYDVINKYSFLDLFNNPVRSISKYVECPPYNITQSGNETLHSVYYIKDWWEKEAAKYGITGFSMDIDVKGPYTLSVDPPPGGRRGTAGTFCNSDLKQFFISEGKKNGIEENNYDILVYVYLSDWQLSGRAYQGFTSCVDQSKLNVFASVPTSVYPQEDDSIVMLIHEVGHTLGASDWYTAPCYLNSNLQSCARDPEGIPEPNKVPKYPQTKACIMSSIIQISDPASGNYRNVSTPDLAVLCDAAAKEIKWK